MTGGVKTAGGPVWVRSGGAAGGMRAGRLAAVGCATEEEAPWDAASVPELRVTTP
jgi:hypothetical protein